MLRADNATFSSRSAVTNKDFFSKERSLRIFVNSFVFGAARVRASRTKKFCSTTLADKADLRAKRRTF